MRRTGVRRTPARLLRHDAVGAVDDDALAGEVAGVRAGEEGDDRGDVALGVAEAFHWVEVDLLGVLLRELLGPRLGGGGLGAGQHDVHANAVLAPLFGSNLGQTAQGFLVGAVGELAGDAEHAGGRSEVDDAALVLLLHVGEGGLHIVEGADNAGLPSLEHVLVLGVLDGLGGHNCLPVVDDDVDGAEGVDGLLDNLEDALAVGGVAGHGEALAAELADLGDGGLDGLEATAGGDDLDAALGEAQRDALADALSGAGDDGDLSFSCFMMNSLS